MSLQKPVARIKEGVTQIQSLSGIKKVLVYLGLGVVFGVIADIVLEAIWLWSGIATYMNKSGYPCLEGFTIFPSNTSYQKWNGQAYETKQGLWMAWDDVILLVITVAMLFSKKFWLVIGFFIGWYSSSYMNLSGSLGIPKPTE